MKKIISKIIIVVVSVLLFITTAAAQKNTTERTDKVTFLNGVTKEGKVVALADEKVKFVHSGETLSYEFNKKEIEKIEYASGRTEIITEKKATTPAPLPVSSKNKVAVIPMQYTGEGNEMRKKEMSFYLQEIAINYLSKSATELKFMDAAEVNALLLKKGMVDSGMRRYTPKEVAEVLNVEYVIMGSVLQDNGPVVTHANSNRTRREDINYNGNFKRRDNYNQSVVTNQHVETHVNLYIYNETGEKIYGKSRQSILSEKDAYKNAIHYMLKRTPLYKR